MIYKKKEQTESNNKSQMSIYVCKNTQGVVLFLLLDLAGLDGSHLTLHHFRNATHTLKLLTGPYASLSAHPNFPMQSNETCIISYHLIGQNKQLGEFRGVERGGGVVTRDRQDVYIYVVASCFLARRRSSRLKRLMGLCLSMVYPKKIYEQAFGVRYVRVIMWFCQPAEVKKNDAHRLYFRFHRQ